MGMIKAVCLGAGFLGGMSALMFLVFAAGLYLMNEKRKLSKAMRSLRGHPSPLVTPPPRV